MDLQLQKLYAGIEDFPKYLADYIDGFVSKQGKQQGMGNEDEVSEIFDVLNLTAQRDAFLHFYEIALKNRLLGKETFFEDVEQNFRSRLSQLFGETQIMKVKGMINDVVTSKDSLHKFKEYINSRKERKEVLENKSLDILLLTKANWPTEALVTDVCKMPQELERIGKEFSNYYTGNIVGRKIEWLLNEGYCEVKASFKAGPKNLNLSVIQLSILSVLDASLTKSRVFSDLMDATKINKKLVRQHLTPLIKSKLVKREKGDMDPIDEAEKYSINIDFQSKSRMLMLLPKKTLKGRDKKADNDSIQDNRKNVIEAAIVRIMKSNKKLEFMGLANEVRKICEHFPPADRALRQMLDDLIKREYLERDSANMNMYIYKA